MKPPFVWDNELWQSTTEGSCSRNLPDGEVNEKEEVRLHST